MVLMHQGGYGLTAGGTCKFVVGMKDCLSAEGYMHSVGTGDVLNWNTCNRRTWANSVLREAFPESIRGIFKQFKKIDEGNIISEDYFSVYGYYEVDKTRLTWFQTDSNLIMTKTGWFTSTFQKIATWMCIVWHKLYGSPAKNISECTSNSGITLFGCI